MVCHVEQSSRLVPAIILSIWFCPNRINAKSSSRFSVRHFRILQILITVGLILGIVGGTSSTIFPNGTIRVASTTKVGIILYIVAFFGIVLITLLSLPHTPLLAKKERRVPVAIVFALPFILVRLVYSACVVFLHNHFFNLTNGNVAVRVAMAIGEEFVVVAGFVALGFLVDRLARNEQGGITGREGKSQRGVMDLMGRRGRRNSTDALEEQRMHDEGHQSSPLRKHHQAIPQ